LFSLLTPLSLLPHLLLLRPLLLLLLLLLLQTQRNLLKKQRKQKKLSLLLHLLLLLLHRLPSNSFFTEYGKSRIARCGFFLSWAREPERQLHE
jgi:hypothetical protein